MRTFKLALLVALLVAVFAPSTTTTPALAAQAWEMTRCPSTP